MRLLLVLALRFETGGDLKILKEGALMELCRKIVVNFTRELEQERVVIEEWRQNGERHLALLPAIVKSAAEMASIVRNGNYSLRDTKISELLVDSTSLWRGLHDYAKNAEAQWSLVVDSGNRWCAIFKELALADRGTLEGAICAEGKRKRVECEDSKKGRAPTGQLAHSSSGSININRAIPDKTRSESVAYDFEGGLKPCELRWNPSLCSICVFLVGNHLTFVQKDKTGCVSGVLQKGGELSFVLAECSRELKGEGALMQAQIQRDNEHVSLLDGLIQQLGKLVAAIDQYTARSNIGNMAKCKAVTMKLALTASGETILLGVRASVQWELIGQRAKIIEEKWAAFLAAANGSHEGDSSRSKGN